MTRLVGGSFLLGGALAVCTACGTGLVTGDNSSSGGSSGAGVSSSAQGGSSQAGSSSSGGGSSSDWPDAGVIPATPDVPPVGPDAQPRPAGSYAVNALDGLPLGDGTWVFNTAEGPRHQPLSGTAVALGAIGTVRAATLLPQGILLATDQGVFVAYASNGETVVTPSPLREQVTGAQVRLLAADAGRIWVVQGATLLLFNQDRLFTVSIPDLDLADAQVAFGSAFGALQTPALWVRAGNTVWAIQMVDGQVRAWRVRDDLDLQDMSVEGPGSVVLRDTEGELHVRTRSGRWYWYRTPAAFEDVSGNGLTSEIILRGSTHAFVYSEGLFRRVSPWPLFGELLGHGPDGRFMVKSGNAVAVHALRSGVTLMGVPPGGLVTEPVTFTVVPEVETDVVSIRYRIDGGGDLTLEAGSREVRLTPNELGVGDHVLDVAVGYGDGRLRAAARVPLRVEATSMVSWAVDVEPLKARRCDRCHGERGNAHVVTTRQQWMEEFDEILEAVQSGRMPLNTTPFSSAEVALLLDWQSRNYPE